MAGNENSGRKLKLNQEFIDKAVTYLLDGNYIVIVCKLMGVSENAWYSWINQGIKDIEDGKKSIFTKFYDAILGAEAQAEADFVKTIKTASLTDAKHAQWWLTHKAKERWADKIDIVVSTEKPPDALQLEAELNRYKNLCQADEVLQIDGEIV